MKIRASILAVILTAMSLVSCSTAGIMSDSTGLRDGSSFEKALIASSVRAEYLYIDRTWAGSKIISQIVTEYNGKPYDIVSITTKDGVEKDVYFDISKFYRKKSYADELEQSPGS